MQNGLIHHLLHSRTYVITNQVILFIDRRIGSVAQKHKNQLVIRVYPHASSRETCMSKHRSWRFWTTRTVVRMFRIGFIKT